MLKKQIKNRATIRNTNLIVLHIVPRLFLYGCLVVAVASVVTLTTIIRR